MGSTIPFPLARRGLNLRGFIKREIQRADHRRLAFRWRAALAALDGGSIATAVRLAPRHRSIVEELGAAAIRARVAVRRCGRRVA